MLSAVDGRPSGRWHAWTTGCPCFQSVCNRTPPATRDADAVMQSGQTDWASLALNRIMQLSDMRLCGVASH